MNAGVGGSSTAFGEVGPEFVLHAASLIGEGAALAAEVFELAVEFGETPVELGAGCFESLALLAEHGSVLTDRVDMVVVHERTPSNRTSNESHRVVGRLQSLDAIVLAPYDTNPTCRNSR